MEKTRDKAFKLDRQLADTLIKLQKLNNSNSILNNHSEQNGSNVVYHNNNNNTNNNNNNSSNISNNNNNQNNRLDKTANLTEKQVNILIQNMYRNFF